MVGIGETYIPAFVLALGLGEIAAGLVVSIPMLIGAILQLISPWAVARLRSNQRWILLSVTAQALSFVPLVVAGLMGHASAFFVFAAVSLYWGAGLASSPAWNAWMETVIPNQVRPRFFATRTRMGQAGILLGFLAGGAALQYGKSVDHTLLAFAAIFAVAGLCRGISARYLSQQHENPAKMRRQVHVSLGELIGRIRKGGSERMLLYFLAVQVAVQISGPYFTPYMLKQLKVSYLEYVAMLATSYVAKILVLPAMGWIAHRFGTRKLLWLGGAGIVPTAGLWLYANSFVAIIGVQFVAGVVWAAYELAMFLLFFETVRRDERTSILTLFNLGNAAALVLGAAMGGVLLKYLGESPEAYLTLFAASSLVRALTLICLYLTPASEAEQQPIEILEKNAAEVLAGPVPEMALAEPVAIGTD